MNETHLTPDIVVGRDRAHTRELTKEFPRAEVLSASAFFDKVRILAFLYDPKLEKDDFAPLIFAQRILAHNDHYPLWLAGNFSSLYSSCYHGTSSPIKILQEIEQSHYPFVLVFELLAKIDMAMKEKSLVNGVSALYHAWKIIKNNKVLPKALAKKPLILLRYLVDLTLLEIEIIKDLSRLGLSFDICFPLDFQKRGINAAVDFAARQFERCEDLTNIDLSFDNIGQAEPLLPLVEGLFKDQHEVSLSAHNCSVTTASDILHEAEQAASQIADILSRSPQDKIAIAVRSIDSRSLIYKRTLLRYGINVRDRKGIPLLESEAGCLLLTIFSAKLWSLPRKDLLGLINHPLFSFYIDDDNIRARMVELIQDIGIDNRLLPMTDPAWRYRYKLDAFRLTLSSDERLNDLNIFEAFIKKIEQILLMMQAKDRLLGHLNAVLRVIEEIFLSDDSSILELKKAVSLFCTSLAFDETDPELSFSEFISLLKSELSSITIVPPDNEDLGAVEFLPLPELLGRSFDHVFIVDISFGRMPQNTKQDSLLDDRARIALNKIVKKPLLRVFFDDPFEPLPVPPRQALEPFWFASAVASARSSIHFSYASEDDKGTTQAPSEFFLWLLDNVKLSDVENITSEFISEEYQRFLQGVSRATTQDCDHIKALIARNRAFSEGETDDFAFKFPQREIIKAFDDRLGKSPKKALTPTMIEAFSECRFKGFSERILNIRKRSFLSDDIDVKALGQIAHRALELFFDRHSHEASNNQLRQVLAQASKEFTDKNYVANLAVFSCHMEWLYDALLSVQRHMAKALGSARSVAQELAFGLPYSQWPPLTVKIEDREYLLGGRIDHVLKNDDGFLVIDYKLSSTSTLMAELAPKKIGVSHFQMPIYLRLVAKYLANDDHSKISFFFVSIRDGVMLSTPPVFERIFNDDHEQSLVASIDRIFAPIMEGKLLATTGEHCTRCDMKYLCRKSEHDKHD